MSGFTHIRYEVEDPCAVITLNRPDQLNAFTYQTLHELRAAFAAAQADTSVVGIIVTGAGRAFSAGLDISVLTETTQSSYAPRRPGRSRPASGCSWAQGAPSRSSW